MFKEYFLKKNTALILLIAFLFVLGLIKGQPEINIRSLNRCPVAFYNVENLFDTINDFRTSDDEFTPTGEKAWNSERYFKKIDRIAEALQAGGNELPFIVGLAEVENTNVLNDIASHADLKRSKYNFIHFDSPDQRGIDVALLYSSKKIKVFSARRIPVSLLDDDRPTRDILLVHCSIKKGPELFVFVNHWPSRFGGQEESEYKRMKASDELAFHLDSLRNLYKNPYLLCMGDFNDYPSNQSILNIIENENLRMQNLMEMAESEYNGSHSYSNEWGFLDQFMSSSNLLGNSFPRIDTSSIRTLATDSMIYTSKKGIKRPNRTYGGNNYYGGYSDHLPIYLEIEY